MSAMRILSVVLLRRSHHLLLKIGNSPIRLDTRDVTANRHETCGGVRWLRGLRWTSAARAYGEIAWSRCPDAGVKLAENDSADDGGYRARYPGESAYKPSNHRAGNAGLFRRTCGGLLACFLSLCARLRVRQTPGIPCALVIRRRELHGI